MASRHRVEELPNKLPVLKVKCYLEKNLWEEKHIWSSAWNQAIIYSGSLNIFEEYFELTVCVSVVYLLLSLAEYFLYLCYTLNGGIQDFCTKKEN